MRFKRKTVETFVKCGIEDPHTQQLKKHVFPLYLIEYGVGPWMTKDVFLL